ncbi:MAG: prolyl oligopeptidase family serine peptidase [Cyanobacteria bacterium]|nr:prolyl oligopeptidase family serine peptidase [Cyanobacteriota bacterium]
MAEIPILGGYLRAETGRQAKTHVNGYDNARNQAHDAQTTPSSPEVSVFKALYFGASRPLPPAPRDASIIETLHGTRVSDPFRPLENLDAPETVAWWKAQNKRTEAFVAKAKAVRQQAIQWHQEIRDFTRESMASEFGGNYFFSRQSGLAAQPTYYVRIGGKDAPEKVILDPNQLSSDGTVSVNSVDESPDGKLIAYTLSESGSDMLTMRFKDVTTGNDVYEALTDLRFTSATWDPDGKGVVYSKEVKLDGNSTQHFATFHHTLGEDPKNDVLLYQRTDVENSHVSGFRLAETDPYLIYNVYSGTNPESGVYLQKPGQPLIEILPPRVAALSLFHREGDTLYAITDLKAARNRIVAIDINNPAPENWKTVVPQSRKPGNKISSAFAVDGKLLVEWSKDGAASLEVRTMAGKHLHNASIPAGSTLSIKQVRPQDKSFEISIGGYLSPGTRYQYTVADNNLRFIKKSDIPRDLVDIAEVERVYAPSKDGTQVPMWVIKPKKMPKDGSSATILYGYGGFDVSLEPNFSYSIAHWVEQGGVYVIANLRGGGEFGRKWYNGGRLKNKQNVFDDFAGCAKALIQQGYTRADRLAIKGGSNGGLLTAVTSQQNPDLFGAVISEVPVTDMLRFHTNNYGAAWMSDYGNPEKKADFNVSIQYSPLHNVAPAQSTQYPPTLIMTGDHDDRVAPWHAFKWAATRQEKGHQANTYLRVAEKAGHGSGKPTQKVIEEAADQYAFLVRTLGPLRNTQKK